MPPDAVAAEPSEVGMSAAGLSAALQRYKQCAEAEDLPGGVLVVASKGKCCYLEAFGKSDAHTGEPMQTDAIFRAASMTKITTSLAAMILADRGQLLLDDPVSKFLPAFESMTRVTGGSSVAHATTTPCATQMTIRHLMAHTSGLTYGFFAGSGPCGIVDEMARTLPRMGACSDESDEGDVAVIAAAPLAFEPGSAFRYSSSTAVLGRIVSVASGVPMDDFLQREICEPLGMVDTAYFVPKEQQHRVVTSYTRRSPHAAATGASSSLEAWIDAPDKKLLQIPAASQVTPSSAPSKIAADGGLFTTASDWVKFMCMLNRKGALTDGSRLLSKAAWEIMVSPATPDLGTSFCTHWSDPEDSAGPALCANFRGGGFAHSLCGEVVS